MTKIEFIKILIENHSLVLTGIFADGLRAIGWWIVNGLVALVDGLEKTATKVYSFNDFFNSKGVNDLLNAYKPLIYGIFVIALLFLGYSIMLQKKKDRSEIPTNILISAMVIIALPLFMTKLGDVTQLFVSYNISEQQSTAKEIVKDNVSDLYYLDRTNFKMNEKKNDIPLNDITNIDINEVLDSSKIKDEDFRDVFGKKLSRNENGAEKLIDLSKGFFGLFDEGYYRYNANFLIIIFSLAITGITLICISLKVAGIIFELGFKKIFATILAMGDIGDGRKLKAIVSDIVSSFAILMVTSVLLKMYVIFVGFLGNKLGTYSILNLVVLAGVSWKVIDAPDIVERILGMDAGVKSNWGMVLAGYEGAKSASRAVKSAGSLAKKGFNLGKSGFSKVKDGVGGKSDNTTSNGNEGIYGKDKNENTNTKNSTSQNKNNTSSTSKNNDNSMNNTNENNKDNSKNDNFSRNSGIYNNNGSNINNNKNETKSKTEGNPSSKINTDKGSSMYGKNNNSDKNINKNFDNGSNNLNRKKTSEGKINTNNGRSIYDNNDSNKKNSSNSNNVNSNKGNSINNKGNKSNNINSRKENKDLNSNNSNFNVKGGNKTNLNDVNNKHYNISNKNKWSIKGKENKK